jgi:hypothetical protein
MSLRCPCRWCGGTPLPRPAAGAFRQAASTSAPAPGPESPPGRNAVTAADLSCRPGARIPIARLARQAPDFSGDTFRRKPRRGRLAPCLRRPARKPAPAARGGVGHQQPAVNVAIAGARRALKLDALMPAADATDAILRAPRRLPAQRQVLAAASGHVHAGPRRDPRPRFVQRRVQGAGRRFPGGQHPGPPGRDRRPAGCPGEAS